MAYQYDENGGPAGKRVEYYHNDHLGNIRLAFSDLDGDGAITVGDIYDPNNEITQERHYYPFGLTHDGPWFATVAPDNAYRYNGMEMDEATGLYDYGARYYDPAVARWGQVDPLAENHVSLSPYNYVMNNPLLFIDPDGRDTSFINNEARDLFNDTYNRINQKINDLDSKLEDASGKKHDRLTAKRDKVKALKDSFDDVISSDQMYEFEALSNPDGVYQSGGGTTMTEAGNKRVTFRDGLDATLVHEIRHAAGFERGEWGWDFVNNRQTGYDYQDEFEGYDQAREYNLSVRNRNSQKSDKEIKNIIIRLYGNNPYIIKEFRQIKP